MFILCMNRIFWCNSIIILDAGQLLRHTNTALDRLVYRPSVLLYALGKMLTENVCGLNLMHYALQQAKTTLQTIFFF